MRMTSIVHHHEGKPVFSLSSSSSFSSRFAWLPNRTHALRQESSAVETLSLVKQGPGSFLVPNSFLPVEGKQRKDPQTRRRSRVSRSSWLDSKRAPRENNNWLFSTQWNTDAKICLCPLYAPSLVRERVNEIKIELNKRMKKERERKRKIENKESGNRRYVFNDLTRCFGIVRRVSRPPQRLVGEKEKYKKPTVPRKELS